MFSFVRWNAQAQIPPKDSFTQKYRFAFGKWLAFKSSPSVCCLGPVARLFGSGLMCVSPRALCWSGDRGAVQGLCRSPGEAACCPAMLRFPAGVRKPCLLELGIRPACSERGCAVRVSLLAIRWAGLLPSFSRPLRASSCRTQCPVALNSGIYSSSGMYFSMLLLFLLQIIVDLCLQVLSCQHFAAAGFLSGNWIALSDISVPA